MPQTPPNFPLGAKSSAAITTNATTAVVTGRLNVFAGLLVNTAGSAWTAAIYDGDPGASGVLLVTLDANAVGAVLSPYLACPNGLYVVTAGTTPGSLKVAYY